MTGIRRRVEGLSQAHQAPDPTVEVEERTPPTINSPELVERIVPAFIKVALGAGAVKKASPVMGAEDFGLFGEGGIPICMFWLGTIDPARLDASRAKKEDMPALALIEISSRPQAEHRDRRPGDGGGGRQTAPGNALRTGHHASVGGSICLAGRDGLRYS